MFYLTASATHILGFMYMSFFFRYRRITFLPTLAIGSAYYCAFGNINNLLYKLIVDKAVIKEARKLGYETQV